MNRFLTESSQLQLLLRQLVSEAALLSDAFQLVHEDFDEILIAHNPEDYGKLDLTKASFITALHEMISTFQTYDKLFSSEAGHDLAGRVEAKLAA